MDNAQIILGKIAAIAVDDEFADPLVQVIAPHAFVTRFAVGRIDDGRESQQFHPDVRQLVGRHKLRGLAAQGIHQEAGGSICLCRKKTLHHHMSAGIFKRSTALPPNRCSSKMVATSSLLTPPYMIPSG